MKFALLWLVFASVAAFLVPVNLIQATTILNQEPIVFQGDGINNSSSKIFLSHNIERETKQLVSKESEIYSKVKEDVQPTKRQLTSKFIILTTGEQIKLYPFALEGPKGQESLTNLANSYYLIKPTEEPVKDQRAAIERFGNNSLSRWIVEKALLKSSNSTKSQTHHQSNRKASILPDQHDDSYENYEGKISGWKKPWILDVDYFFDSNFCLSKNVSNKQVSRHTERDCLVIVWLDKSNKLVRFGSLDLSRNPIQYWSSTKQLSGSSASKNKVLWLREFKPIDVSQCLDRSQETNNFELFSMTIDKRRSRLHVAFSDGSQIGPNRILSGKFRPDYRPSSPNDRNQLDGETVIAFNQYSSCDQNPAGSTEASSFENLSVDEDSGNWLFYFDKHTGGKIYALNVNSYSETRSKNPNGSGNAHFWSSNRALVRDIPLGGHSDKIGANTIGLAMDPKRRRLFWLTDNNELYSCDYLGRDSRFVGSLSSRPAIRSVETMQVFHDIIYVSDPIKKSLIAYHLNNEERDQSNRVEDKQQLQYNKEVSRSDNIRSTHLVLLVEMPTLYGFRLIDLNQVRSADEEKTDKEILIDKTTVEPTFLEQLQFLLTGKPTEPGKGDELDQLLGRTYTTNIDYPCDQPVNNEQHSINGQHFNDKFSLILLEIVILHLAVLLIWFLLPWLKHKMNTQREVNSDKTSILKKCPV